jgi:hypothetical protein
MNRRSTRTAAPAATLVLAALLLSACGGGDDTATGSPSSPDDLAAVQVESGVPEACLDAFPVALTEPDLGDLTLLPASWPAEPAGATLCQTSATVDGSIETVDYATDRPAADVLDAYESALSAHDVSRTDQGLGPQLVGTVEGVAFEITPREGAFTVVLSGS